MVPRVTDADTPRALLRRLVASSALMLLLELVLIRWLGANVVHLSYFSNFVLLGSFLGVGLGFLISRKPWSVVPVAMPLLACWSQGSWSSRSPSSGRGVTSSTSPR